MEAWTFSNFNRCLFKSMDYHLLVPKKFLRNSYLLHDIFFNFGSSRLSLRTINMPIKSQTWIWYLKETTKMNAFRSVLPIAKKKLNWITKPLLFFITKPLISVPCKTLQHRQAHVRLVLLKCDWKNANISFSTTKEKWLLRDGFYLKMKGNQREDQTL